MVSFEILCIECGTSHDPSRPAYACSSCGNLLEARIDEAEAAADLAEGGHSERPLSVWKYREAIPIEDATQAVTIAEGGTPMVRCRRLEEELEVHNLWIKFEGANPTGSFKDRGMTVGVTKAIELGMSVVTCASTGNTSASLAAYAAAANLDCAVLIPEGKVAMGKLAQAMMHGADVLSIKGNFDQALEMVMTAAEELGMYVLNSVNPFRIEGQKTAAYEICDQLNGVSPERLYIPVGNGGNSAAYWKGFREYDSMDLTSGCPLIRGIQAEGAAPIASMFSEDRSELIPVEDPETVATAIRIGNPANWKKTVAAIKESGGSASTVTDEEILEAQKFMARLEGIFPEPAGAAALAGFMKDLDEELVDRSSVVVCVSTGHGLKDPDTAIAQCAKPRVIEPTMEALSRMLGGAGE
ncbi:MAG: threonine synthase [Methanobacteriota archaeon]|nr:MAG: threonine synthase [Euryarchaeota archaeon]